ncbi:MAG: leucine-rich repeat protein [Ruminococcus sp.]|nr:leucine-rich repeat protein [Ruminococcus sp.]
MKTKKMVIRTAALLAAITLTSGAILPVQNCNYSANQFSAYAEGNYTTGEEGIYKYLKYSDHIEISFCNTSATSADIPSTIEGLPVTVIGMYAFQNRPLKSVTIPDTVTEIGHYAFGYCSELKSVTIPDSVQKIGIRAFESCPALEEVNFPDHLVEIQSNAFENTAWLKALQKEDPLVIINGALVDAQTTKGKVVIPSSVKYVCPSAFARNLDVTSVVFPSSVSAINDNVFFYCSNLESVEVKGATFIDSMAFAYCNKLTDVKLSGKLTKIDERAFSDITARATITFYGSKETWNKVEKKEDDPFLKNATYIFDENHIDDPEEDIEGDVNMDGKFNVSDIVLFQQWLLGNPDSELKNWKAADFIKDEHLDHFDLIAMRKELIKRS